MQLVDRPTEKLPEVSDQILPLKTKPIKLKTPPNLLIE